MRNLHTLWHEDVSLRQRNLRVTVVAAIEFIPDYFGFILFIHR